MSFVKRTVIDRAVQYPKRFKLVLVAGTTDTYDLVPITGTVTAEGTIINKAYLQPIEDYLSAVKTINNLTTNAYVEGEAASAYQAYLLQTQKAPNSHASSATTYGLGTTAVYGHVKVRNDLLATTFTNGEALASNQGKILKDMIDWTYVNHFNV